MAAAAAGKQRLSRSGRSPVEDGINARLEQNLSSICMRSSYTVEHYIASNGETIYIEKIFLTSSSLR